MAIDSKYKTKDDREIIVRLCHIDEYDSAMKVFSSVAAEKIYLNTETVDPSRKERWSEMWSENGKDIMYAVAEVEGEIVGGEVLTKYSESPKTNHVRDLGMWIIKEFRGIGIGNALMDYSLNWARANGNIKKILLGLWSTNSVALNFYLKFGFHIDGSHQKVAKILDYYADEILMSLDL